jgi:hypothetical protein
LIISNDRALTEEEKSQKATLEWITCLKQEDEEIDCLNAEPCAASNSCAPYVENNYIFPNLMSPEQASKSPATIVLSAEFD